MANTIKITITGDANSFVKAAQQSESATDKLAATTDKGSKKTVAYGTALVGVGAGLLAFGKKSIDAALSGEKSEAVLDAAIRNTGTALSSVEPKVQATEEKFAKYGYTNDQVRAGLAALTSATGSPTRAISDLGETANLAAAKHLTLEKAATLVGKVELGNVGILSRYGIQTKDAEGKTLSSAAALDLLRAKYAGVSDEIAKTPAGKLAAFHAQFENLEETVGNQLLPILARFGTDAVQGITAVEHAFGGLTASEKFALEAAGGVVAGGIAIAKTWGIASSALEATRNGWDIVKTGAKAAKDGVASFGKQVAGLSLAEGAGIGVAALDVTLIELGADADRSKIKYQGFLDVLSGSKSSSAAESVSTLNAALKGQPTGAFDAISRGLPVLGQASSQYKDTSSAVDQLNAAIDANPAKALKFIHALQQSGLADDSTKSFGLFGDSLSDLATKAEHAAKAARDHADAEQVQKTWTDYAAASADAASKKWSNYANTLHGIADPIFGAITANQQLQQSAQKVTAATIDQQKALQQYGASSDQYRQATQALSDAEQDQVSAALNQQSALANLEQGFTSGKVSAALFTQELKSWVSQGAITQSEMDGEIAKLGALSAQTKTLNGAAVSFTVDAIVSPAEQKIHELQNLITQAARVSPFALAQLQGSFHGGGVTTRAAGGPVRRSQPYLVNELGHEMFEDSYGNQYLMPASDGTISPHSSLEQVAPFSAPSAQPTSAVKPEAWARFAQLPDVAPIVPHVSVAPQIHVPAAIAPIAPSALQPASGGVTLMFGPESVVIQAAPGEDAYSFGMRALEGLLAAARTSGSVQASLRQLVQ